MDRNIQLIIAYDGTGYHGFQRQANALAIQQILEERLALIFGHRVTIHAAARTDTGVHAYGQSVSVHTTGTIPLEKIPAAAKSVLPDAIVVLAAAERPPAFNARYDAKSKIYVYRLRVSPDKDPFMRHYSWHIKTPLAMAPMEEALKTIEGTHDFSAFQAQGGEFVHPVKTIYQANCRSQENLVELEFWGSGFLYHMVRNLVGTLVDVGHGRVTVAHFAKIMASKNRKMAGITAPPQGLFLKEVIY
jgi:tRNA pseudouridine38-40 synthase